MSESRASERVPEPADKRPEQRGGAGPEPDVLLDVPELSVDEIRLAVDGLDADLSLRARLANLLQLDAGVRVHLEGVELDITGVRAEALLKVRLEKLVQILDRALTTIDRNPHLIDALARSVGATVEDVHRTADQLGAPVVDRAAAEVTASAVRPAEETAAEFAAGSGVGSGPVRADEGRADRPGAGPGGGAVREAGQASGRAAEPGGGDTGSGHGGGSAEAAGPGGAGGKSGAAVSGGAEGESGAAGSGGEGRAGGDRSGGGGGAGPEPGSAAGAAQLAGQAGQTLRQAGRSVWEAIQGGMAQNRPPRRGR
ncbi:hypothetical protein ACIBP4_02235 [Micromonospora maritima]|uniref:Uncharacterized protein n=1 Tax=Micromonospora maritima TaxID=986711 RepID=A0ABW7ZE37_9ACTN